MLIGMAISWVIKLSFWVPHRFRYGILAAGGWANIGDIRKLNEIVWCTFYLTPLALATSVALSIMASAPFNGTEDENLAVGYIAAFILVFCVGTLIIYLPSLIAVCAGHTVPTRRTSVYNDGLQRS
jgi:hypothetical protein